MDANTGIKLWYLTSSIQKIEDRVLGLELAGSSGSSPAPKRCAPESDTSNSQSLADRDLNEREGRSAMEWSDNKDDDPPIPVTSSEDNLALVASSFSTTLSTRSSSLCWWQQRSKQWMQNLPGYRRSCWIQWVL